MPDGASALILVVYCFIEADGTSAVPAHSVKQNKGARLSARKERLQSRARIASSEMKCPDESLASRTLLLGTRRISRGVGRLFCSGFCTLRALQTQASQLPIRN